VTIAVVTALAALDLTAVATMLSLLTTHR